MLALRAVGLRPALRTSRAVTSVYKTVSRQREIKTESLKPSDARLILDRQRLNRPSSPHFTIYEPQVTWYLSIMNRITGAGLSVGLYAFLLSYVAAPVVGVPFESGNIVDLVHQLPEWVKYTGKTIVAAPFAFHSLNGVRHLIWDSTKMLSNRAVTRSGYLVLAGSAISTAALVLL